MFVILSGGVMAKVIDNWLEIGEFEPQLRSYVYFKINTPGKVINFFIRLQLWVK